LIFVFASLGVAQVTIQTSSESSFNNKDYDYRSITFVQAGNTISSESVVASGSAGSGSADVVVGTVSAILGFYEYLYYYAGSYSAGSYTGLSSFVAANYLTLTETDTVTGNQLSFVDLSTLSFVPVDLTAQTSGSVHYATFKATGANNFQLSATVATSQYAGQLTNGAVVTPKSLEVIFNILNYPYIGSSSNLTLTVAVGIAKGQSVGTFTVSGGYHVLTAGSGQGGAYFSGSTTAIVNSNGQTASVSVTSQAQGSINILGTTLAAVLNAEALAVSGTNTLQDWYGIVNFTAQAQSSNNVTIDPGAGWSFPSKGPNAAMGLTAQFSILALCFALLRFLQF